MLVKSHQDVPARLASDTFEFTKTMEVSRRRQMTGLGYGTEFQLIEEAGPLLKITADDIVIEDIRFVYTRALPAGTLIARPVRCSGDAYNPAALSTSTTRCAIEVTGDNVTIRNCWFDGWDNAIYTTGSNTQVKGCYFKGATNTSLSALYLAGRYGQMTGCYVESTAYGAYVSGNDASVTDNVLLGTETGLYARGDFGRLHGNCCLGEGTGFALLLTHQGQSITCTGNSAQTGTLFLTTGQGNLYSANIGTVDLE